jgi:hypothetical protein
MLIVEQLKRAGFLLDRVHDLQRGLVACEKADSFTIEVVTSNNVAFGFEDVPHNRVIEALLSWMRVNVARDKDELATLGVEWTAADDAAIEAAVAEHPGDDDEILFEEEIPF